MHPKAAARYAGIIAIGERHGMCPILIKPRDKTPLRKRWQGEDNSGVDWAEHYADGGNVGLIPSAHVLVIDVDTRAGGDQSYDWLQFLFGLGESAIVLTGGGGRHVYLALPSPRRLRTNHPHYPGIDFKSGTGGFVVAAGSTHPNGKLYRLAGTWPDVLPMAPDALLDELTRPERTAAERGRAAESAEGTPDMLATLLAALDPRDFGKHGRFGDEWLDIAMGAHFLTGGEGVEEWLAWCAGDPDYGDDAREMNRYRWESFSDNRPDGVTFRTLLRAVSRTSKALVAGLRLKGDAARDFEVRAHQDRDGDPVGMMLDYDGDFPMGSAFLHPIEGGHL